MNIAYEENEIYIYSAIHGVHVTKTKSHKLHCFSYKWAPVWKQFPNFKTKSLLYLSILIYKVYIKAFVSNNIIMCWIYCLYKPIHGDLRVIGIKITDM